jgi:hypothetical protein
LPLRAVHMHHSNGKLRMFLVFCPRGCSLGCTGICGRTGRQGPSSSA